MDITPENIVRENGYLAQKQNIKAGETIYEIMKSTLGPKGMDKLLVDGAGNITTTNDGVTILTKMDLKHPAARMIAEASKTQEEEIGDGTTTVAMLAGKLLSNAGKLINKRIHPTVIIKGYNLASIKCQEFLKELAIKDISNETLKNIAMTAMTGKGTEEHKDHLANLIVDAVTKTKDKKNIKIERVKGKEINQSELIEGMVINNPILLDSMPKKLKNPKIALIESELQVKNPEMDVQATVSNPTQLRDFAKSDKEELNEMVKKIIDSKANVVLCQKGIDDYVQSQLAKNNIMAMRRVAKFDMEHIAKATNGRIVSSLEDIKLGTCDLIEENELIYIRGCPNNDVVCILLTATTSHVLDEVRRAVTDAIGDVFSAINQGMVLPGGGAIEIALSKKLKEYASTLNGREQLAVDEFGNALESIPESLAENAGLDSIETLTNLRHKHKESHKYGLNLFTNKIEDTFKAGIIEPLKIKQQAISSSTEVTTMILRVDDILISKNEH